MINLLLKVYEISRNQRMSADKINSIQQKKFKKLLKYVLENSSFYKRFYGEYGITIDKINDVSIEDLPVIDKKTVMDNFDELVCDPVLKRKDMEEFILNPLNSRKKYKKLYKVIHTSGSSGTTGIFVYGPGEWNTIRALGGIRVSKVEFGLFHKLRLAFIGAVNGNFAGISLAQDIPELFMRFLPININSPLEDILKSINKYKPEVLAGYPSGIYMLAQEQLNGKINIKPLKIICSAEVLTGLMRSTIIEAFGVDPIDFYAACESIGMACECEKHHGLHVFNDLYCIEVVDKNLKPVPKGQPGNILLTNLFNYTQPLIRYKMDDIAVMDDKPAECRWPFPIIKSISGRQEEYLWFEKTDGSTEFIHPTAIIDFFVPGLNKLKIIQTGTEKFVMKVVIKGDREKIISDIYTKMKEILMEKALDKDVSFAIEVVSEIENDKLTGKYRLIVPYKKEKIE